MTKKSREHFAEHDMTTCEFCRNKIDFSLPNDLLQELRNGNVVLFAGAGISTENTTVFRDSFYETISNQGNCSGIKNVTVHDFN